MTISIKHLSKQVSIVALLSLPFIPSLEAAGWLDALSNSRIGQWFSAQPKGAQIGMAGVTVLGVAAATYFGYRYLNSGPIQRGPISLSEINVKPLEDYRIYAFGSEGGQDALEQDIKDLLSVFDENDTSICSTKDRRYLFPEGYIFNETYFSKLATSGTLQTACMAFGNLIDGTFYTDTDTYIMRDAQQNFVGFVMTGIKPSNQPSNQERSYILFVAPTFRGNGCAKKLLHHMAQGLLQKGITELTFSAYKNNPACRWYDTFGFGRTESSVPTHWDYSGTITN